jgi:hypothetical protein
MDKLPVAWKKLTKPQRKALIAVQEGHIWVWKGGGWGQSRWSSADPVRRNVLDRLLAEGWIEVSTDLSTGDTYSVTLKDRE